MRLLHLIRHGPVIIDFGRPSSQWELEPGAVQVITKLAHKVIGVGFRHIVSSSQSKAIQTARVLANELGVPVDTRPGLEEHHRLEEHSINSEDAFHMAMSQFFARPMEVVFGTESAFVAVERFHRAIHDVMAETDDDELIVSHGTVIRLLIKRGGNGRALPIWRSLTLPDHVLLEWPSLRRINA